jgi:S1-C subfamily serine protease
VVGVITAADISYSFRGASSGGQGFAVPLNEALSIVKQIESGVSSGTVHVGPTAFLGVELASGNYFPGTGGYGGASGALVAGVLPGSPAAKAGLAAGDVITALGGQSISSADSLISVVAEHRPGDRVQVAWTDQSGQSHTATVQLASGPAQ